MLLETGGHVSIERVPAGVVRIVDVKCPGSGEAGKMRLGEPRAARPARRGEVRDRATGPTTSTRRRSCARGDWASRVAAILFSPVHGQLPPAELAAWVLADRLPVRVQLQVHKYIWEPGTRGV